MKGRIKDFLHNCETIDFGKVELSRLETAFYKRFNSQILSLCKSLPESAQTDAMLFLMKYSGLILGDELDFFANYYPPSWSILYWLSNDCAHPTKRLKKGDVADAIKGQSMAMFLHSLDDHLTDSQIFVSPLTLLLRSQAWMIMNRAFGNLAEGVPSGERTVRSFIDDYYSSIQDSKEPNSLDGYCGQFRRQMGIGMVAPVLLSMKMTGISDFTKDIETAYGSFGIAWRLLDDIRDINRDIEKGSRSAIYFCLPRKARNQWNNTAVRGRVAAKESTNAIFSHILENGLIGKIKGRICAELEEGASIVEAHNMTGLSREFRCLAHPLRNKEGTSEERHRKPGISLAKM